MNGVWRVRADHLLILADSDTLALDDLDVLETRKNLVLDLELGNHGEFGSLHNLEWLVLQGGLGALCGEIDDHWWAARGLQGEGENDALAWVIWVGDGWADSKT